MSEKERQVPYGITYMWNLKLNLSRESIEQICVPNGRVWGRMDWEFGVSRYKRLHIG